MDLNSYITSLRNDLGTVTSSMAAGDEASARAVTMLAAALEPAARLTLMSAMSDLAAEVTAQLEWHVVDVRLDGRDVRVVVTDTASGSTSSPSGSDPTEPPPAQEGPLDSSGDISRITVRLFEELKGKAEHAASAQGMSLNSFVQQAVAGALQNKTRARQRWSSSAAEDHAAAGEATDGQRIRGWVRG
ncbi:MAG: toxin-antitoxin system HicB family antitoxin [Sciscionella sp.]